MSRPFSPAFILEAFIQILPYLGVTLYITAGTVLGGSMIGLLLARAKLKGRGIGCLLAEMYIYVVRSTPSIVLLFLVFYGLPELILGTIGVNCNSLPKEVFVLITFIILFSSSMAEIMRSAYLAVDKGQYEAALCAGLSPFQGFYRIMLPQCTVVALPNFANALTSLIKEGALAYTVGLVDIMGKGKLIIGNHYGAYALETYLALTIIYWSLTVILEKVFGWLERRSVPGRRISRNKKVKKEEIPKIGLQEENLQKRNSQKMNVRKKAKRMNNIGR